jgi:hypothetical protein
MHALLGGRGLAQFGDELAQSVQRLSYVLTPYAYIHIVVQLHAPRAVKFHLLQRLADHIVRLVLRLLRRLDHGALVEVALVVDVELAEGILQPEDLALLELRVLPARNARLAGVQADRVAWKCADAAYFCSLMMFIVVRIWCVFVFLWVQCEDI